MMKKILICSIAVTFVVTFFALGCSRKEAPKPKEAAAAKKDAKTGADEVQHKVLAFNLEGLTDRGAKKWDVKGESAEALNENEIGLVNIVATAYGEEAEAIITADKGIYDKSKNNVRLQSNVKATIDNTSGFSENFTDFSPATDKTGKGGPKAAASDKKKSRTVITCDGEVLFDYEKNLAYFTKNVKVVSDDGAIDADKITVNLDTKSKKVRDIMAEGNVKITRGDNTTFSDKATYIEGEKKVVLSGKPKLVIYREGGEGGGGDMFGGDIFGK